MRRAFTLIELLVIVAIIGTMVTVSVVNLRSGQEAARLKGAARDVFAAIRNARSIALVKQQPVVVTYSTRIVDESPTAVIEVTGAEVVSTKAASEPIETLSGEPFVSTFMSEDLTTAAEENAPAEDPKAGKSVEDVLFADIREDVVRGICIKVTKGDEELEIDSGREARERNRVSIFSNVDYLLGKYGEKRRQEREEAAAKAAEEVDGDDAASPDEEQEPVSIVWEVNGRTEPHRVWVYASGTRPDSGLSIAIDRYGAARILAEGEDE